MNQKELTYKNIENLTSLWAEIGLSTELFSHYKLSYKAGDEWPNRLWFDPKIEPNNEQIKSAIKALKELQQFVFIPHWELSDYEGKLFEKQGFKSVFEQTGMSTPLNQEYKPKGVLNFEKVNSERLAKVWTERFYLAFGYHIDPVYLIKSIENPDVVFYLAKLDSEIVGTGLNYYTGNIAGIHSVGVIPSMRRKGFAKEIMLYLLNQAQSEEKGYATLQASSAGKPLYDQLGFQEDFVIRNYVLEEQFEEVIALRTARAKELALI